jgi:hypothetical protein
MIALLRKEMRINRVCIKVFGIPFNVEKFIRQLLRLRNSVLFVGTSGKIGYKNTMSRGVNMKKRG